MHPADFHPARGTRRNIVGLDALRALGRENGFHGLNPRVLTIRDCIDCNANIAGTTAAYLDGYTAGKAERAERLVRIAADARDARRYAAR